jgi:hypothetical protein
MVIYLKHYEWLAQPGFAFTRGGAAPPDCGHPLAQAQIEPFPERRIDQPTVDGQDPIHRRLGPEYHLALDLDDAPPPHLFVG